MMLIFTMADHTGTFGKADAHSAADDTHVVPDVLGVTCSISSCAL